MSKRKRYVPRAVNPMAHLTAILGSRYLSTDDIVQMSLKPVLAVDQIRTGKATQDDWQIMFDACNLLEALVKFNHASDPDGLIESTQDVIATIADRFMLSDSRAVKADELSMLRDFCTAYSQVLGTVTNQEVFEAFDYVRRNVQRVMSEGKRSASGIRIKKAQ